MRGVGLHVAVEEDEVINSSYHGEGHNCYPHSMYYIAFDCAIDENAVADQVVVVEVPTDDGGAQMDDDTSNVDHDNAKNYAAQAALGLPADIMLTKCIGLTADHGHYIEPRRCDNHNIGATQDGTKTGRHVAKEALGEGHAVATLDDVKHTAMHNEGTGHLTQRLAGNDAGNDRQV